MDSGFSYPLQIVNGSIRISDGENYIRDQIKSYVETLPSERVFWRDYGCSLEVFEAFNGDLSQIMNALNYDLNRWVSTSLRINSNFQQDGNLDIEIRIPTDAKTNI
jgi:phage baseplate assembly protein W